MLQKVHRLYLYFLQSSTQLTTSLEGQDSLICNFLIVDLFRKDYSSFFSSLENKLHLLSTRMGFLSYSGNFQCHERKFLDLAKKTVRWQNVVRWKAKTLIDVVFWSQKFSEMLFLNKQEPECGDPKVERIFVIFKPNFIWNRKMKVTQDKDNSIGMKNSIW